MSNADRRGSQPPAAPSSALVCRCREVTEEEVLAAIRDGARSVRGVKVRTRAATGLCQGHTCGPLIESILRRELGGRVLPDGRPVRPPVRPLAVKVLGSPGDSAPQ